MLHRSERQRKELPDAAQLLELVKCDDIVCARLADARLRLCPQHRRDHARDNVVTGPREAV